MVAVFNQLRAANTDIQARRYGEAESAAREALKRDPDNAFALMIAGRAEMEQGRYADAIAHYRRYAGRVPASADAHHWIAVCLSRANDVAAALKEEDAALALDARHAEAHALRGGLLARSGRIDEAVSALQRAVEAAPGNVGFQIGLGRLLISARRLDEAQTVISAALSGQTTNPDARAAFGSLLVARGDFASACSEFERSLSVRPEADDVRLDYADALVRAGRQTQATTEYRRLAGAAETPADIRAAARSRMLKPLR
jgi:Tfp pilus assembly protein PilF